MAVVIGNSVGRATCVVGLIPRDSRFRYTDIFGGYIVKFAGSHRNSNASGCLTCAYRCGDQEFRYEVTAKIVILCRGGGVSAEDQHHTMLLLA